LRAAVEAVLLVRLMLVAVQVVEVQVATLRATVLYLSLHTRSLLVQAVRAVLPKA
jgi:hypothetical protein